jgi:hypothetical protein
MFVGVAAIRIFDAIPHFDMTFVKFIITRKDLSNYSAAEI